MTQVYLCPSEHDEDWTFECNGQDLTPGAPFLTEWYTVCGKPHSNKELWVAAEAGLAILGTVTYRWAFAGAKGERPKQS